jgi:hypothetical protein
LPLIAEKAKYPTTAIKITPIIANNQNGGFVISALAGFGVPGFVELTNPTCAAPGAPDKPPPTGAETPGLLVLPSGTNGLGAKLFGATGTPGVAGVEAVTGVAVGFGIETGAATGTIVDLGASDGVAKFGIAPVWTEPPAIEVGWTAGLA